MAITAESTFGAEKISSWYFHNYFGSPYAFTEIERILSLPPARRGVGRGAIILFGDFFLHH